MRRKQTISLYIVWASCLFGYIRCVDISFENPSDGFFLKEFYHKDRAPISDEVSRSFVVNQAYDAYKIRAANGPFEAYQTIPQSLMDLVHLKHKKNNSRMHRNVLFNMDVSAHIVSDELSPKLSRLQVLVHASPRHIGKPFNSDSQDWCAQVYVETLTTQLSSVCILNRQDSVCVAGIDLHRDWWSVNGTEVNVSYSLLRVDQNNQCASAANSIIPAKSYSINDSGILKQHISTLHLTLNERSFDEWKDQDILIDVPRDVFHHGDSFEIPIRLEAGSDLQVFVMRARVRQGLRITGARMTDPSSQWSIHVDIKERQKTGTVTAFVRDARTYRKSQSVQEMFHWQMEVDEDLYDTDTGRIVWSIEYQRNGLSNEHYTTQDSKIVSRINIRSKGQQTLVPVLKVSEVLNLAILTGNEQVYPMRIYAVDDSENVEDVTLQTKCHSVEVDVLKVASDCTAVYVDGAESRGSHNVSIIAKSGRVTAFVYIGVWIPEDRLDIQLSNNRLSQIRGWKVPLRENRKKRTASKGPLLPQTYEESSGKTCHLRLQQATVEVYTRFHIQSPHHTDYFMGRKAFLKITDLVKQRLRMSDSRIASLNGNLIEGHGQGRTEVQILSPRTHHILSAREIRVGTDKVMVTGLSLRLVTGLTLDIQYNTEVEGTLLAKARSQSQLRSKFQEGVINVDIQFSDSTKFPLRYVDPEDYFLETTTLNPQVVGVAPAVTPYQPHIVAVGQGRGDYVEILLGLGSNCRKRKSKVLVRENLHIESDFSQEYKQLLDDVLYQPGMLGDAHYDTNRASGRWDGSDKRKDSVHTITVGDSGKFQPNKVSKQTKKVDSSVITINDNKLGNLPRSDSAAIQEPVRKNSETGLTPIEIGMYVLLAIFCIVVTVLMVKCIVFVVKYKQKRIPKTDKTEAISSANDWVWIGRATLERNSVNTRCSQTLMPEEDFNGNHTQPSSSSCSSSSSGSAPNSNRNSTVSTYKGSECSIRITANPMSEANPVPEESRSEGGAPQWDYEAMGMNYDQLLEYFDSLKESTA